MAFEVEQKFVVEDVKRLELALENQGIVWLPPHEQQDSYFNHPARDFATTDEALRIRRTGEHAVITYKGPRRAGDVKTREELELPLGSPSADFDQLLVKLSFRPVAVVIKRRRPGKLRLGDRDFEVCLDQLQLDDSTTANFAEIETVCEEADLAAAQAAVQEVAAALELTQVERRSYLTIVLSRS